jgi:dUTP pyrophosphatase
LLLMSDKPPLALQVLPHGEGLPLPSYQTDQAAGMDLYAALLQPEEISLSPGERALIPTGLILAIGDGYEGQVRPRSGLAVKHGLTVLNAPGTIDADYRGEVKVILINLGSEPVTIKRGDRIAQLVLAIPVQMRPQRVLSVQATKRGESGFGSTG